MLCRKGLDLGLTVTDGLGGKAVVSTRGNYSHQLFLCTRF